jgi:hypothetical protein
LKVNKFEASNRAKIDKTVERGKQVKAFCKAMHEEHANGISWRQCLEQPPLVSVARASEPLEENMQDVELKAMFQSALDHDDDDDDDDNDDDEAQVEDLIIQQQDTLMGAFFVCVCVEVQSWFTGPIVERGFGSSHSTTPLDKLHLMQNLETSDKGVDACEFITLLTWAAVDGQVGAKPRNDVFQVEVPKDDRPGLIKNGFVKWFMEILEISRSNVHSHAVSVSEHEDERTLLV